jgi:2-isopropylmalate synthase
LDAFCNGIEKAFSISFSITMYQEHAMESGSDSAAITYVEISDEIGNKFIGAGISSSVTKSSLRAVVSAMNRMVASKE